MESGRDENSKGSHCFLRGSPSEQAEDNHVYVVGKDGECHSRDSGLAGLDPYWASLIMEDLMKRESFLKVALGGIVALLARCTGERVVGTDQRADERADTGFDELSHQVCPNDTPNENPNGEPNESDGLAIIEKMDSNEVGRWVTKIRNMALGLDEKEGLPGGFGDEVVTLWADLDWDNPKTWRATLTYFLIEYFKIVVKYAELDHPVFGTGKALARPVCRCWHVCGGFLGGACAGGCGGCI